MSELDHNPHEGHRNRLRRLFINTPAELSEAELLELLLGYVIPRKDVAPIADKLIQKFSNLSNVLIAPPEDLSEIEGIGESTLIFLKLINTIITRDTTEMVFQPDLFNVPKEELFAKKQELHAFGNDEIATSLEHLPAAGGCDNFAAFKTYLNTNLPYNSVETRQRRANYILNRFYPGNELGTPLTVFTQYCKKQEALKPVIFYHMAKAEQLLAKVADDFVYPALPLGKVGRGQLKEYVSSLLSDLGSATLEKAVRSIINSYDLLDVGRVDRDYLKCLLHPGNLEAFGYILAMEYPEPGIYTFESLYAGPAHQWLLWDKEWMRKQLYVLRDMGVLSKVSEIDSIRQFSLELSQRDFLERFLRVTEKQTQPDEKVGD